MTTDERLLHNLTAWLSTASASEITTLLIGTQAEILARNYPGSVPLAVAIRTLQLYLDNVRAGNRRAFTVRDEA